MADRRNLKVLRAMHGLTTKEIAERIGVSRSTYSEIENAKRGCSPKFLEQLQAAFDIPDEEVWKFAKIFEESEE